MSPEPISIAAQVIAAFGGLSALARALGHRHVSTVDGWQRSGRIPRWRNQEILSAAQRLAIELPQAFVDQASDEAA